MSEEERINKSCGSGCAERVDIWSLNTMDDCSELIRNVLKGLEIPKTGFKPGELAYLTLTSKPELPIRDRLAFELQKMLDQKVYSVAREFPHKGKRIDIAILERGKAKSFIQIKVSSFFNFDWAVYPKQERKIEDAIKSDIKKCKASSAEVYGLMLAPNIEIETRDLHKYPDYSDLITSWKRWNSYKRKVGVSSKSELLARAQKTFQQLKSPKPISVNAGEINAGSAFELKVTIPYWLFRVQ